MKFLNRLWICGMLLPIVLLFWSCGDDSSAASGKESSDEPVAVLDLDSAAVYYAIDQATHVLSYKMRLFWKLKDSLEIVGLGNSRMLAGFAASRLEHGLNMATAPCDLHVSRYLTENYLLNHCPKLRYLVVSLDFDLWDRADESALAENFGSAPGYRYDAAHGFWKSALHEDFVKTSQQTFVENQTYMDAMEATLGQEQGPSKIGWYNEDGTAEILEQGWDESVGPESNYQELLKIIQLAKDRNIRVVGVVFPMSPAYRNTDQYGRHGLQRNTAENFLERLKKLDEEEPAFILMDENQMGNHDYESSMAYDYDHLSFAGSKVFTERLDSLCRLPR